jgi:hypothetical protein
MLARGPQGMRTFTMHREYDVSGVSGTGIVVEGVMFTTGVVVVHWLTPAPRGSIGVWDSIDQFLSVHVQPHPENRTVLAFDDGETITMDGSEHREITLTSRTPPPTH